ncbi:MAG: sterol desaturase family protein [Deltaproteobacteria bacterium]|nr:MAG: sterol desaturase family protein [Deltaproteobacteria bacterium]
MQPRSSRPRFWIALQPSIVRIYKMAGLVALTAILVGLVGFLIINIFYFFDHTWVRPVVLSPTYQRVVEASTQLADSKLRASQLATEKLEVEGQLLELERVIAADDTFIAEVGSAADAPRSGDQWLLRRELEKTRLEKENMAGKRVPLGQRIDSLKLRIKDQDAVVNRLAQSPYLKAIDNKVTLAFVANQNLKNVKIGTPIYGCAWGLVWCHKVGTVKAVLDGEV